MKYYLETFGCQMNLSDSEVVRGRLEESGFESVESPSEADVLLVNTCAIREHAEIRAIGRLSDLFRYKKRDSGKVLGILGCIAQHYGREVTEITPGVDLVMGPDNYRDLPEVLNALAGKKRGSYGRVKLDRREMYDGIRPRRASKVSAWVQVMRGCDRFCSYCIVPYVRGRERSRGVDEIVREVVAAVNEGILEVVLLGQNVNAYHYQGIDFPDLLARVSQVPGIHRIRFITSHPLNFTEKLIRAMHDIPQVCNTLHLPLQSGSNRILAAMGRGYTVEDYREKITLLREAIPAVSLSTDLMVGFPGETDEDFRETMATVGEIEFDNAFMFKYSPRKGTKAARYTGRIENEVASRRLSDLIELQRCITANKNRAMVGSTLTVVVEGRARRGEGKLLARTEGDKTVVLHGGGTMIGSLVPIRIVDCSGATLIGELVENGQREHSPPFATGLASESR